jgi:hypothetical protein
MIKFTQYLRPDGRTTTVTIERPADVEAKAKQIVDAGFVFTTEVLTTGEVAMYVSDSAEEEDFAIEVVANGPEVLVAVDRMIMNFEIPVTKENDCE